MIVTASVLNVRSGPGTDFRVVRQLRNGATVNVVETHGDWAWVDPAEGWVSRAWLAASSVVAATGLAGILTTFGHPGSREASAGRVVLPAPLKLGWSSASITRVSCHVKLEEVFTAVFREIHRRGMWHLLKTFDGIYNNRDKTGQPGVKSTHAWGIAVDLNADTNRFGTAGDMPAEIIEIFEAHGFLHLKQDPMHFQFASGY